MRPQIVLNLFTSLDGRLTTAPNRNVSEWTAAGIDGGANEWTHRLYDELDCDGLISGSESLIVWGSHWVELQAPIYQPQKSKAFIVFDGRGRMNWNQSDGLVVVTRENVSAAYIAQLEQLGVPYILAGNGDHIDLQVALHKLYELGFRRLGLTGGGKLNGAFLRQGLIDEFSVLIAPVAVGGTHTPTLLDCPDITSLQELTQLELIKTEVVHKQLVWMYYKKKELDQNR